MQRQDPRDRPRTEQLERQPLDLTSAVHRLGLRAGLGEPASDARVIDEPLSAGRIEQRMPRDPFLQLAQPRM